VASDAGSAALAAIEAARSALVDLSEKIHRDPELGFNEHKAAAATSELLETFGFRIERGIADLPTAFCATFGSGSLCIGLMAEYDALPEVGHACGHNLIAASSVAAGIGLAEVADELDLTVKVFGTPAEEGGGGKVIMLDRGAFEGVHAAMMVHPWSFDRLLSGCLAVDHFDVTFEGRTAHASAAPWEGINAGDAMVIAQTSLALLRQQLRPGDQIHGVITHGGDAANIIPARVTGRFMIRSTTASGLEALRPRVRACFEAGALASGAAMSLELLAPPYTHMEQDPDLLQRWRSHAEATGRTFERDDEGAPLPNYSTDMANISLAIPSIHPLIGIDSNGAVNHQPEFTAACVGPSAEKALFDGATAMALTAIDAATTSSIRSRLLAR
jgi:amidohydrolase